MLHGGLVWLSEVVQHMNHCATMRYVVEGTLEMLTLKVI